MTVTMTPASEADPPGTTIEQKPGYVTTEFWMTVIPVALSFAGATLALLHPGFRITPAVQQWATSLPPVAAGIASVAYALSRGRVKAAAHEAAATIATAQLTLAHDTVRQQKAWDIAVLASSALDKAAAAIPDPTPPAAKKAPKKPAAAAAKAPATT